MVHAGFYRSVNETTVFARALEDQAGLLGISLLDVDSATDAATFSNKSIGFGIQLGTEALTAWYNVHVRQSEALALLLLQNTALQVLTGRQDYRIQAQREFMRGGASIGPDNVFSWLSDVQVRRAGFLANVPAPKPGSIFTLSMQCLAFSSDQF